MKILTNENYRGLISLINQQKKEIESLRVTIRQMKEEQVKEIEAIAQERDRLIEQNKKNYVNAAVAAFNTAMSLNFPNTEPEGGPEINLDFLDL